MKIHLKLLTERYWFRLGLSLCFAITAALSYANRDFIWMGLRPLFATIQHLVATFTLPYSYQTSSFHD